MLITTTPTIEGHRIIEYKGIVTGETIIGANFWKDIKASIRDIVGGRSGSYERVLVEARETSLNEMAQRANEALGNVKAEEEKKFMEENKKNEGVQETESGLQYKIEVPGNELKPGPQDTVEVHYKGCLTNGKQFDSSYDRGETIKFPLNGVIPGWSEGLQLIGEGGKEKLWIPFNLGYGGREMGPDLPAYSTLVFNVELIKVFPFAGKDKEAGK